jgi:hypothetical protein
MDELIKQAMVCTKHLANMVKRADFDEEQIEVIRQTVYNGQVIVQGLHEMKKIFSSGNPKVEDEFLASYFSEQAETYLIQTKRFIEALDAINV